MECKYFVQRISNNVEPIFFIDARSIRIPCLFSSRHDSCDEHNSYHVDHFERSVQREYGNPTGAGRRIVKQQFRFKQGLDRRCCDRSPRATGRDSRWLAVLEKTEKSE